MSSVSIASQMDSHKTSSNSNENSELKTFMANLRSGNLARLIETNKIQSDEKCANLTQKLKKFEDEMRKKSLILQQNANLIEKFQNQLQELSDQNSELLDQQQVLKEENVALKTELQCSEDKFAQLDVVYDEEVSSMSETINKLEMALKESEDFQSQWKSQFKQNEQTLEEMLKNAKQHSVHLENQLRDFENDKKYEMEQLQQDLSDSNNSKEILARKIIDYEEQIQDLQKRLSSASDANKELLNMKNKIEQSEKERVADQDVFEIEKSQLVTASGELKMIVEDLKKRLSTKEKEMEEIYLKHKQQFYANSVLTASVKKYPNTNQASSDDPKPFDDSTDSDCSSVSFYKKREDRQKSLDTNDYVFSNLKKSTTTLENKRKPGVNKNQFGPARFRNKANSIFGQDIEIPESPIVSSSAFGNNDQK